MSQVAELQRPKSLEAGAATRLRAWLTCSNALARLLLCAYRWVDPVLDVRRLAAVPRYVSFLQDVVRYRRLPGAERLTWLDTYPCLHDKTKTSCFDRHYFYQDAWAFRRIVESGTAAHVDVGSRVDFVGMLAAVTKVTFIDLRPLEVNWQNLGSRAGTILALPLPGNAVASLSCLHVAEHIGLGRYGDALDPQGTLRATRELARVLAPGGNLYFSVPVGKPRVCFNAHRIHSPEQILDYFDELELAEFSAVGDDRVFYLRADLRMFAQSQYACGLFWFRKPTRTGGAEGNE